jgi:hypothetical protein
MISPGVYVRQARGLLDFERASHHPLARKDKGARLGFHQGRPKT